MEEIGDPDDPDDPDPDDPDGAVSPGEPAIIEPIEFGEEEWSGNGWGNTPAKDWESLSSNQGEKTFWTDGEAYVKVVTNNHGTWDIVSSGISDGTIVELMLYYQYKNSSSTDIFCKTVRVTGDGRISIADVLGVGADSINEVRLGSVTVTIPDPDPDPDPCPKHPRPHKKPPCKGPCPDPDPDPDPDPEPEPEPEPEPTPEPEPEPDVPTPPPSTTPYDNPQTGVWDPTTLSYGLAGLAGLLALWTKKNGKK